MKKYKILTQKLIIKLKNWKKNESIPILAYKTSSSSASWTYVSKMSVKYQKSFNLKKMPYIFYKYMAEI